MFCSLLPRLTGILVAASVKSDGPSMVIFILLSALCYLSPPRFERWGAGVETQKNVRGEIGGWVRVPFNEPYAPS